MKKLIVLLTVCVLAFPLLASCNDSNKTASSNQAGTAKSESIKTSGDGSYANMPNKVQIEMKNGGKIVIELYPDIAPITVNNFKKLVSEHFYDGLIFHRVIKGFMIQGGDPKGTGTGGPGYTIKGEFTKNGVKNTLLHKRGVISMARSQSYDSAGSQFFIMHEDYPSLDGLYAAFGKVSEGMDIVDRIANVKTDSNDKPIEAQVIKSITFVDDNSNSSDSSDASSSVSKADTNS